jgi:hypothetical protein
MYHGIIIIAGIVDARACSYSYLVPSQLGVLTEICLLFLSLS